MRRPRLLALALLAACHAPEPSGAPLPGDAADRIRADIAILSDDRMEGRGTGTAGNDSAAAWLARRHGALGLRPLAIDTARPDCRPVPAPASCRTYLQRFVARGPALAHDGRPEGVATQNVIAMIPGRDAALAGEYVVIGAHFDHLGRSPTGSMDPEAKDAIRNGADDNASGTAAVLELTRSLAARPARRSVIVAHFTGEELGLLGSQWLVEHMPVAVDSVAAMLNFDMVGRLRGDRLIVYGTGTATELPRILEDANAGALKVSSVPDGFGPSDHSSFHARGIPVLHFFTDLHDDYHRASDDVERIDAAGEARVVALAERVLRTIADRPARLTPKRTEASSSTTTASGNGSSTYLGSIPDMSAGDPRGLRLTGVRAGSPADVAGLRAGDVIVVLAGTAVTDLYSYSRALYAHQPGERITIGFLRNGEPRTVTVVLGKRGQ